VEGRETSPSAVKKKRPEQKWEAGRGVLTGKKINQSARRGGAGVAMPKCGKPDAVSGGGESCGSFRGEGGKDEEMRKD